MARRYDHQDVKRACDALVGAIAAAFDAHKPLNIIGIRTRGETLAERLARCLKSQGFSAIERGVLDVTLYRDDLSEIGPRPLVRPSEINVQLDGVPVLLVDDVLFTGRSVRAAMDALTDFGRPSVIKLAVLVDRGGRELPIQADFVGLKLDDAPADHRVQVQLFEDDGGDAIANDPRQGDRPNAPRGTGVATTNQLRWTRRHLLTLESLSADELRFVLDTADSFKEVSTRSVKKVPALRGRVVVNAFWEDSTRTRTSFELAAQRLSADVIDFSA